MAKKTQNLLQQLENNEAVLLMFIADELPAEDRAEVEQLLATDAVMRGELERLRQAMEVSTQALAELDAVTPLPVPQAAALRQTGRLVRQWQVDRLSKPKEEDATASQRGLRYPWWVYPVSTAAALVLAFVAWWGNQPGGPEDFGVMEPEFVGRHWQPDETQVLARDLQESFFPIENSGSDDSGSENWSGGMVSVWVTEDAVSSSSSDDPISTTLWNNLNQTSQNTR